MFEEIVKEVTISLIKKNQKKSDKERIRKGLFHLNENDINKIKSHGENGLILISSNDEIKETIIKSKYSYSLIYGRDYQPAIIMRDGRENPRIHSWDESPLKKNI